MHAISSTGGSSPLVSNHCSDHPRFTSLSSTEFIVMFRNEWQARELSQRRV